MTILCNKCRVQPSSEKTSNGRSCPKCGRTLTPETLIKAQNDHKDGVPQHQRDTAFIIVDS